MPEQRACEIVREAIDPAILTSLLGTDRVAPRCADPTLIPSSILWVPGSVSRSLISAFTGAQPRGHGSQAAKHDR
jgi:hypothetical protein